MLHSLHWLPIEQRIEYKLSLVCFISHQAPVCLSELFTFTLPPGSSALLQTPECSEYRPSKQSPVVCTLSLTRLQLFGTSSLFLSVILLPSFLSNLPLLESHFFSPFALIYDSVCVCVYVCVFVLYELNFEHMCV